MTTSFTQSSQSLLSSCLSASAKRISLSKSRPLTTGAEKGVSEMKQSEASQSMCSEPFTISPYGSPGHNSLSSDLEDFSLTACSYQTMQLEYDRDTWRMYERIQSARPSHEQHISFIEDRLPSANPSQVDHHYDDDDRPLSEADDESEGIFEFDF